MSRMAPLTQKIRAEHRMRELLREADLPQPDTVEYDDSCIRLFYDTQMVCLVIDMDPPGADDARGEESSARAESPADGQIMLE
jgi:hypothetical protein